MNIFTKNQTKYALIMCLLIVVCLVTMEVTGNNRTFEEAGGIMVVGQMLAPLVVWYLAIKEKKKAQKGKLTFKEGFIEGFKVSVLFGLISPFIFLAYYIFVNPAIVNSVSHTYMMDRESTTTVVAVDMVVQFISAVIFGSIYAAIISFFVKSKKK